MRVSNVEVVAFEESCQLQAWVASERDPDDARYFEPFLLWYRYPAWCRPFLSERNGDPFLAALLVAAMRAGERLAIAAPVSPRLLAALPELQAIYRAFDAQAQPVAVEAPARTTPLPTDGIPPGVGLFLSLGVDSFYSLLKNARDHPADRQTITNLITVHGIDVPFSEWDEAFPPDLLGNAQRAADETGTRLIPVVTNVRRETGGLAPWIILHGGGLIAASLALGVGLRRIHVAASTTYDKLYPWGSHPVLDPLWSTEGLSVLHDGCELNTIDKTRFIVDASPGLVLETLRPCAGYGPGYNCGACPKCMRTMLDLLSCGMLDACRTLPHAIDVERFREVLRPGGPVHVADYTRRLRTLESLGIAPEVQQVIRDHLAGGMAPKWAERGYQPAGAVARRRFGERLLRRFRR